MSTGKKTGKRLFSAAVALCLFVLALSGSSDFNVYSADDEWVTMRDFEYLYRHDEGLDGAKISGATGSGIARGTGVNSTDVLVFAAVTGETWPQLRVSWPAKGNSNGDGIRFWVGDITVNGQLLTEAQSLTVENLYLHGDGFPDNNRTKITSAKTRFYPNSWYTIDFSDTNFDFSGVLNKANMTGIQIEIKNESTLKLELDDFQVLNPVAGSQPATSTMTFNDFNRIYDVRYTGASGVNGTVALQPGSGINGSDMLVLTSTGTFPEIIVKWPEGCVADGEKFRFWVGNCTVDGVPLTEGSGNNIPVSEFYFLFADGSSELSRSYFSMNPNSWYENDDFKVPTEDRGNIIGMKMKINTDTDRTRNGPIVLEIDDLAMTKATSMICGYTPEQLINALKDMLLKKNVNPPEKDFINGGNADILDLLRLKEINNKTQD